MPQLTRRHALGALAAAAATPVLISGTATSAAANPLPGRPGNSEHVLFIDLDGFDPRFIEGDYAHLSALPNIRGLVADGAYGVARGSFPSYSNASRATMATGMLPRFNLNAGYYYNEADDVVIAQERYIEPGVKTLAQSLRAQGVPAAYVQWYIVENYGAQYGDPLALYTQPGGDVTVRMDQAIAILRGEPVDSGGQSIQLPAIPRLLTVYADSVDALLHSEGFTSPNLPPLLDLVDAEVGRLLDTLEEVGLAQSTTVLLTADHAAREWTEPILPELMAVVQDAGFITERVSTGSVPSPETEVIVVAAPRTASIALRGRAARGHVETGLARDIAAITGVHAVYDRAELRGIGASPKMGYLVAEPTEPYHFSSNLDGMPRASHGGWLEAEVPMAVRGPGIEAGSAITGASLMDIAPAIHRFLGVPW